MSTLIIENEVMSNGQLGPDQYEILGVMFELDELRNIVNHGMRQGVSGFIYSSDLYDIFQEHESTITDYLDGFCEDNFNQSMWSYIAEQLSFDDQLWTKQEFIEYAVLLYVELRADELVNDVDGNW